MAAATQRRANATFATASIPIRQHSTNASVDIQQKR
jgi:hypothetical protein